MSNNNLETQLKHENWIKTELMPDLVNNGTFKLKKVMKIENCEINRLTTSEAFMLTMCYRIKLTLHDDDDDCHKKEIGLILKVKF